MRKGEDKWKEQTHWVESPQARPDRARGGGSEAVGADCRTELRTRGSRTQNGRCPNSSHNTENKYCKLPVLKSQGQRIKVMMIKIMLATEPRAHRSHPRDVFLKKK